MNHDNYMALRRGKLDPIYGLTDIITDVGSGVYAYSVMLSISGRDREHAFYEEIRTKVFSIRSRLYDDQSQGNLDKLSAEMQAVYKELNTAYIFLQAHKPAEATILQSVTNTACGLVYLIKEFHAETV